MNEQMRIARLRAGMDELWMLDRSSKCCFEGFRVNMAVLKGRTSGSAVLSRETEQFLNSMCISGEMQPEPSVLYSQGEDTDLMVLLMQSKMLRWPAEYGNAETGFWEQERLHQEIQVMLTGDLELQRIFLEELREHQKEYRQRWIHYHTRIQDFWETAQKVCFGAVVLPEQGQKDWLDHLFFSNEENELAFHRYLEVNYENEANAWMTISEKLKNLHSKVKSLARTYNKSAKGDQTAKRNKLAQEILGMWDDLWNSEGLRWVCDSVVMEDFGSFMSTTERMLLGGIAEMGLVEVLEDSSLMIQRHAVDWIATNIKNAMEEWRILMGLPEGKKETETSEAEEPEE